MKYNLQQISRENLHTIKEKAFDHNVSQWLKLLEMTDSTRKYSTTEIYTSSYFKSLILITYNIQQTTTLIAASWEEEISSQEFGELIVQILLIHNCRQVLLDIVPASKCKMVISALDYTAENYPISLSNYQVDEYNVLIFPKNNVQVPPIPESYTIKRIGKEDVPVILSNWKYEDTESSEHFSDRLQYLRAYGAYFNDGKKNILVAWTQQYPTACIGMTYTLENHRRKGLAKTLTLKMCQSVIDEGRIPSVKVLKTNEVGFKFHVSMGFKIFDDGIFLAINCLYK